MKETKNYDPNVSAMALFKFFNILKGCIIDQEGKKWRVSHCTNIRLTHGLNGTTYDKNGKLISLKKKRTDKKVKV